MSSATSRVIKVLHGIFGPIAEISPHTQLDQDLYADSLSSIQIASDLEHEFGIDISDDEIEAGPWATVADIISFIERRMG